MKAKLRIAFISFLSLIASANIFSDDEETIELVKQKFDTNKWLVSNFEERGQFIDDLRDNQEEWLHNRSKLEILGILGEPDDESEDGKVILYQFKFLGMSPETNYYFFSIYFDDELIYHYSMITD